MHAQPIPFVADRKHCLFLYTRSLSTSTRNLFTLVERFCREPISGNTMFVPPPSDILIGCQSTLWSLIGRRPAGSEDHFCGKQSRAGEVPGC